MIPRLLETALGGILPNGETMKAAKLNPGSLIAGWNKVYDVSLPLAGQLITDVKAWTVPETPNDGIFEVLGSYSFRTGMSYVIADMNRIKMNIWTGQNPIAMHVFNKALKDIAAGVTYNDNKDPSKLILGTMQKVIF